MVVQENYPLSQWLIDLRDIVAKREFLEKKTALLLIVEEIEPLIEMYEENMSPQGCYEEYFKD